MRITKKCFLTVLLFLLIVSYASADVRLKDVAYIKDQSEIQLKGPGLVMGLNGTGDGKNTQFTIRMIGNMMNSMGIDVPATAIKVKNVAAVMVTATVSPYVKIGGPFDVNVASMGDAKSLEGGTLLMTSLSDVNDILYAKAQGPLSLGGSNKNFGGAVVVNNDVLAGIVSGGGLLEREIPALGMDEHSLTVSLRNPDYTTAFRLSTAINAYFESDIATSRDAGTIIVNIPDEYANNQNLVKFISEMEVILFMPDEIAKVVINERTGTIITGSNVSLAPVAIMHGMLSLTIGEQDTTPDGIQSMPSVQGREGDRMVSFGESANVGQIARVLNMLGVTPRDLIAIFQALKVSGSLRAELIVI